MHQINKKDYIDKEIRDCKEKKLDLIKNYNDCILLQTGSHNTDSRWQQ